MIKIQNLSVKVEDKQVINNLNLSFQTGKIHVLMGPNGSGKSSLAYTLMGHPAYQVTNGEIYFNNQNILELPVFKRAKLGFFLSFQSPLEIPGLKVFDFLKESYFAIKDETISVTDFYEKLKCLCDQLKLDHNFLDRNLNEGFSGGEKKRLEILQMLLLKPKVAIIDEVDSGLDVDSLKLVSNAISNLQKENPDFTIILITHYKRILEYINPDFAYVLINGNLADSGDISLVNKIESQGYNEYL